jgi:hypothetical protein
MGSPSVKRAATSSRKPYQPAIGREFEVEEVLLAQEKNRGFLVRLIALATVLAVGITGIYGLITGAYFAVVAVWSVAGPLVGAMMAFYFGSHRKDLG